MCGEPPVLGGTQHEKGGEISMLDQNLAPVEIPAQQQSATEDEQLDLLIEELPTFEFALMQMCGDPIGM